jgi:hypothetical protein
MGFWKDIRKRREPGDRAGKNARGIWIIKTQILGVHCNVHGIAGGIGIARRSTAPAKAWKENSEYCNHQELLLH